MKTRKYDSDIARLPHGLDDLDDLDLFKRLDALEAQEDSSWLTLDHEYLFTRKWSHFLFACLAPLQSTPCPSSTSRFTTASPAPFTPTLSVSAPVLAVAAVLPHHASVSR